MNTNAQAVVEFEETTFAAEQHDFIGRWKDLSRSASSDYQSPCRSAKMNMLRRLVGGGDPYKGFSPITNPNKLRNGMSAWGARDDAMNSLSYHLGKIVDGRTSPDTLMLSSVEYAAYLLDVLKKA